MIQKIKTHELERESHERGRGDGITADLPAPRSRSGPQLKGPPPSKLQDLNMQVQGC